MNFTSGINYFPIKNSCLYNKKRYKALISGMTDFAYLNNCALEVLTDHFFFSSSILSANLDTKSRFLSLVELWL